MYKRLTVATTIIGLAAIALAPMRSSEADIGLTPLTPVQWIPADDAMYASGISGYAVSAIDSETASVIVSGAANLQGQVLIENTSFGGRVTVDLNDSRAAVVIEFYDDDSGAIIEDNAVVATWMWLDTKEEYAFHGLDNLENSLAWGLAINILFDDGLRSSLSTSLTAGLWWVPARIAIHLGWCIQQCNCCAAFWATYPPLGTPVPACCGHCNSWYCLDF